MRIKRLDLLAGAALTASAIFYILGLVFPILSSKTSILGFVLEEESMRLVGSIDYFWEEGDVFLALVILIFTIVFPIIKYLDLSVRLAAPQLLPRKLVSILKDLDKWSMLDVFLVALLILNFKLDTSLITMNLEVGTSFIALSVILRMISSHLIGKIAFR
ncbi:paraquat-inducible protein A [Gilvibacter sp.]|uniref:paraquat-inducible protein A n=1 Tax=Gilvibacter sp. TaxID=2729997 RepID=UPI003F4A0DE7